MDPVDAEQGPPTEREQEAVLRILHRHLDGGRIDLDEFDHRCAALYGGTIRAALMSALDGLPLLDAEPAAPTPVRAPGGRRRARTGRHGEPAELQAHWVASQEVFRDPSTGRVMRVWIDPGDGTRHYAEVSP